MILAAGLVLFTAQRPAEAAFPGANGKIVFTHQTGIGVDRHRESDIYAVTNRAGSTPRPLVSLRNSESAPAWSADGKKLAFSHGGDLWTAGADGSRVTRLTNTLASEDNPAWSPDGTRIVFEIASRADIYVMNANGSGMPQRLTTNPESDFAPAWSPEGKRIAFSSDRDAPAGSSPYENTDVYVMDAAREGDANQPKRLTDSPGRDEDPNWAPRGNRIVFTSEREGDTSAIGGNLNIYSIRSDGSDEIPLTRTAATDRQPAYSPTGRKIAFVSDRSGNDEIYVMDFDGTDPVRLTFSNRYDYAPDWQSLP